MPAGLLRLRGSIAKHEGVVMAIYRTLYYTDVSVGVGGRVTIPQDMREDLGIDEGDSLTVRVEENPRGGRQMVIWRAEQQPEEDE
jgi:AbrB family looped-hinge helix DNA binding protein